MCLLALALGLALVSHARGAQVAEATQGNAPTYSPRMASGTIGAIERLDPRLDDLLPPGTRIEVLAEGFEWSEGPVWFSPGEYLLFSDVPRDVVWKWKEFSGLTEYLQPSGRMGAIAQGGVGGANGLTLDNDGRLILCQHGDRQVARLKQRTRFEPLATNFQGRRFNSPNDLALRSNGDLYFTDPPYGLAKGMEDPKKELPFQGVYLVSRRGRVSLLTSELTRPNGIALSPDERRLYVAVSDPERAHFLRYDILDNGSITNGKVHFDATPLVAGRPGLPDGIKVDLKGNLWGTGPGGVLVITPEGQHLGTIRPGPATANCAWGNDGSVLYLTASSSLCRVRTATRGLLPGPLPTIRR